MGIIRNWKQSGLENVHFASAEYVAVKVIKVIFTFFKTVVIIFYQWHWILCECKKCYWQLHGSIIYPGKESLCTTF